MNPKIPPAFIGADCLRCAQASAEAYTYSGASDLLGKLLPETAFCDETTDTQGFIRAYPSAVVVALRGTTNLRDVLTDCKFHLDYGVHHGFHKAAMGVMDKIWETLHTCKMPVLVTGHSLGGALAVLIADELRLRGTDIQGVYTFGQPRVGDRHFRGVYNAALGDRTFRIVNSYDPIPWLPGVLIGYRHVGHELLWMDGEINVDLPMLLKLSHTTLLWTQLRSHFGPESLAIALKDLMAAGSCHHVSWYRSIALLLQSTNGEAEKAETLKTEN